MSQTEMSPRTASLRLLDGSLAFREHTWQPEIECASSSKSICRTGMEPTSEVVFQTHQGLEAILRSLLPIVAGVDSSEALPCCQLSRFSAVCSQKL